MTGVRNILYFELWKFKTIVQLIRVFSNVAPQTVYFKKPDTRGIISLQVLKSNLDSVSGILKLIAMRLMENQFMLDNYWSIGCSFRSIIFYVSSERDSYF